MKRQKEAGLQYLMNLGIRAAKDKAGMQKQLEEKLGKEAAQALLQRVDGESDAQVIYDLKNADLNTALAFSGAYDSDIYRKVCNWIDKNRDVFGGEILEVGCDSGIMSCFLGRTFPEAHITSIDRTPAAIAIAQQLADRMGVTNVTFRQCDVMDLEEQQFDTVFSLRTMHENIINRTIRPSFQFLLDQAVMYGNTVSDYADALMGHVRQGGNFVSIERGEVNPMFLGWLLNIRANGMTVEEARYEELHCTVLGNPDIFQAVTAVRTGDTDSNVYGFWCSLFSMDPNAYQFYGWQAETLLQNSVPDLNHLLEGCFLANQEGEPCGKYVVWSLNSRPGAVLYYQGNADGVTVSFYDASLTDQICAQIRTIREQSQKQGLLVTKLEDQLQENV